MDTKNKDAVISQEVSAEVFTLKFRKPMEYEGKTYKELHFDFDKLTGNDSLAIEEEVEVLTGRQVLLHAYNSRYLLGFAARSCTEKVGSDMFGCMPVPEFNSVKNAVRRFLTSTAADSETEDIG